MAKFTGKGAEISVRTTGATPAWQPIGQVAEIGAIDIKADEVEVTTLDAGDYRDYIQGFKDPGECKISVMWDPAMTDQADGDDSLWGMFANGDMREWMIRENSSATGGDSFLSFQGFVRDWNFGALNPSDPQKVEPTIRIAGPVTLSDVQPTTMERNGEEPDTEAETLEQPAPARRRNNKRR